jgi:ADP-ribose pyrophosphatase YjhB (NUDIX family)
MPEPTVGVLIIKDNKVLLVKHTSKANHLTNKYGLPAGHLQRSETEKMAAIRELAQETGLETTISALIELPTTHKASITTKIGTKTLTYKVFKCISYKGKLKDSEETSPEWISLSQLSKINLLPNVEAIVYEGQFLL